MRVVTILGTRPEIIRLSLIIQKLVCARREACARAYRAKFFACVKSDVFFQELGLRKPDYCSAEARQTLGGQLSVMFGEVERVLTSHKPDVVLLLGDTNSALCAIIAERMGIPVVHMEAGNRCYDLSVPEEKNSRIIDAVSINQYAIHRVQQKQSAARRLSEQPDRAYRQPDP